MRASSDVRSIRTTLNSSFGSTQKNVPPAPPQLKSPGDPTMPDTPDPRRTATLKPKPWIPIHGLGHARGLAGRNDEGCVHHPQRRKDTSLQIDPHTFVTASSA